MLAWSSCTHGTHASHMYDYGFYIYVMKIALTFDDVQSVLKVCTFDYFLHLVDKDVCSYAEVA